MNSRKIFAVVLCVMTALAFTSCAKKTTVKVEGIKDLDGLKIGCQAGTTGEMWCQENLPNATVISFKTGIDAALDLKNGAIDAIVLDELPAEEIVSHNSKLAVVRDSYFAENKEEYAIAVKKGNKALLASIDATINAMKQNGEYEMLSNAFMPVDGNVVIPVIASADSNATLKLGTESTFPPFEYVDGMDVVGFDISLGQLIARDYGKKLEVISMNFDSLIGALQSGAIDFIAAGLSITEERKQNVDFSVPYYQSEQVIIIKK